MIITDVRIQLVKRRADDTRERRTNLLAIASLVFDNVFAVHGLKLIESETGLFISMPDRPSCLRCGECQFKNTMKSRYCNNCGTKLPPYDSTRGLKEHYDIVHPTTTVCRDAIRNVILREYDKEILKRDELLASSPPTEIPIPEMPVEISDDFGKGLDVAEDRHQ